MGILGKIITTTAASSLIKTTATKAIIKTIGHVAVETTGDILHELESHEKAINKINKNPSKQLVNKQLLIKPPTIDDFIGEHFLEARAAFIACGFTDISFIELKDLRKGWLTKDGEVEEISIGGKKDIKKKDKFSPHSPVVIVYHTFRDNKRESTNNQNSPLQQDSLSPYVFCSYCGTRCDSSHSFCSKCGQSLSK